MIKKPILKQNSFLSTAIYIDLEKLSGSFLLTFAPQIFPDDYT